MSNPGVINLASNEYNFRIEDNIGESIHLHLDKIRVDLTVAEFFEFSKDVEEVLSSLIKVEGFSIYDIDPLFLAQLGPMLLDLEKVTLDKVHLSELRIDTKGIFNLPVVRKINKSRVYKALLGNTKENMNRKQINIFNESNNERVDKLLSIVKERGYPFDNSYIVLYNDQNNIADGQHRAACLFYLHGDIEIFVKRYWFKEKKYSVSRHPWIYTLFKWDRIKIRKTLRLCNKIRKKILFHLKIRLSNYGLK